MIAPLTFSRIHINNSIAVGELDVVVEESVGRATRKRLDLAVGRRRVKRTVDC